MTPRQARFLSLGWILAALASTALGYPSCVAPQGDVPPPEKVKSFANAVRDVVRLGSHAGPVLAAQAKTESAATNRLLDAIRNSLKEKAPAAGVDTAPSAIEPVAKKLVLATRDIIGLKERAIEPIAAAVADPANEDVKEFLVKADGRIHVGLCLAAMRKYLTDSGGYSGTFDGMYVSLEKYDRDKIGDAFLEVLQAPAQSLSLRELAGEGLAQLGSKRHLEPLKTLAQTATEQRIQERAMYTLYRLGDPTLVKQRLKLIETKMAELKKPEMTPQDTLKWAGGFYSAALINQTIHDTDAAIKSYQSFLAAVEPLGDKLTMKDTLSSVYYNLACLYSLKGDVDGGLKALEKSFELGWSQFKWAAQDGDLTNLRKDERFQPLLEKWESGKGRAAKPESAPASRPS
jgi:hypothetical protein